VEHGGVDEDAVRARAEDEVGEDVVAVRVERRVVDVEQDRLRLVGLVVAGVRLPRNFSASSTMPPSSLA
jgi:hypothetical protein